jgi:hypothetical protein
MKTLALRRETPKTVSGNCAKFKFTANHTQAAPSKKTAIKKARIRWFADDCPENLTYTEAFIRGAMVVLVPMISAIDWNYGTHALFFIAPVVFYLEFTVFTMFCPAKSLLSSDSR